MPPDPFSSRTGSGGRPAASSRPLHVLLTMAGAAGVPARRGHGYVWVLVRSMVPGLLYPKCQENGGGVRAKLFRLTLLILQVDVFIWNLVFMTTVFS